MAEDTLDVDKIEELHSLNEVGECLYANRVHKDLASLIAEVRRLREKYEPKRLVGWHVEYEYKFGKGMTTNLLVDQVGGIAAHLDPLGQVANGRAIDHIVLTPVYQ